MPSASSPTVPRKTISLMVAGGTILMFMCSAVRHALFRSTGFDLGINDQVMYLISQGETAASTLLNLHHMGNHVAWVFYPMAIFYWLTPNVHWLFLIQAFSLAIGVLPTVLLAQQARLETSQAIALAWVYLLYPVVFNVNLFDFHPEVMALPLLLTAIYAARSEHILLFTASIIWILGCKDVLSLTVAAMGIWLLVFDKRRVCGAIALGLGITWFLTVTQWIIPSFSGLEHAALGRYSYLGESISEILTNLVLKPGLLLGHVFRIQTLEYLILLCAPIFWGLIPSNFLPLISAIPTLCLNILSQIDAQRDLVHQYSLPILPFLLIVLITNLQTTTAWLKNYKVVITWALIGFLVLAKYGYFFGRYLEALDTWSATRSAIAQVISSGGVLTDNYLAPHFTHRSIVHLVGYTGADTDLTSYEYVVLNLRHPWHESKDIVQVLAQRMSDEVEFKQIFAQDDVVVFARRAIASS